MFTGKIIGTKQARAWNQGITWPKAPCLVCRVECANQQDLDRHMANRHSKASKEKSE